MASDYLKKRHDSLIAGKLVSILCDLHDKERHAARDALVDTLGLRKVIADPFRLNEIPPDEDASRIIEEACRRFGLNPSKYSKVWTAGKS